MRTPVPDNLRLQQGVGLIEVLVASLILAIGVLGFAGMQMQAVRVGGESHARVQATAIAQDLIERITMNDSTLVQGANGYAIALSTGDSVSVPSSLPVDCQTGACTSAQMVTFDVGQVAYYAATLLPGGLVSGQVAATGSRNLQVFVAWGGTKPVVGSGDDACMSDASGTPAYLPAANCVMLEATFQ